MPRAVIAVLLLTLTAVACEAPPSPPTEQVLGPAELSRAGGCGDVFIYAITTDDTVALAVNWSDAATRAHAEGEFHEQVSVPHPDVRVTLQIGRFLSDAFCDDVISDRPQLFAELPASSGELELTVVAEPGAQPSFPLGGARLVLRDVVFEVLAEDGVEIWRIESLELSDVEVGWFPG